MTEINAAGSIGWPVTTGVPERLQEALKAEWLAYALAPASGGRAIVSVELAGLIRTVASKARIAVVFEGDPEPQRFCLKAFLDHEDPAMGGNTTLREADFYTEIGPRLSMRTPKCVNVVVDRKNLRAILVMEDLVAAGARFCSALDLFEPAFVEQTLDQIARLHAAEALLEELPWVPTRITEVAANPHLTPERLQRLMNGERGSTLTPKVRDASLLLEAIQKLAAHNRSLPQTLLHGDCHAGNIYETPQGPGFTDWQLVQRGNWALDVAYHIPAMLPVEVAERHERELLSFYLAAVRRHGGRPIEEAQAWDLYRAAQPYGFYLWAITQMVDPKITVECNARLGAAVARHGSYELLGL